MPFRDAVQVTTLPRRIPQYVWHDVLNMPSMQDEGHSRNVHWVWTKLLLAEFTATKIPNVQMHLVTIALEYFPSIGWSRRCLQVLLASSMTLVTAEARRLGGVGFGRGCLHPSRYKSGVPPPGLFSFPLRSTRPLNHPRCSSSPRRCAKTPCLPTAAPSPPSSACRPRAASSPPTNGAHALRSTCRAFSPWGPWMA